MAKSTFRVCGPDDPIYKSGPQVFVPVSRPSMTSSSSGTDGAAKSNAAEDPMQPAADGIEAFLKARKDRAVSQPEKARQDSSTAPTDEVA